MSQIPQEVIEALETFHNQLEQVENGLENHFAIDFETHLQRPALDQARVDLMSLYTANSLFWVYLCTLGLRPANNDNLQKELGRIKEYMAKLKQIEDKEKRNRVDKRAAKSFVRNALFEPEQRSSASHNKSDAMEKETPKETETSRKRSAADADQDNDSLPNKPETIPEDAGTVVFHKRVKKTRRR